MVCRCTINVFFFFSSSFALFNLLFEKRHTQLGGILCIISFVLILLSMLFDPIHIHIYTYLYIDILYTTSSTAVVSGRIIRIMVKY